MMKKVMLTLFFILFFSEFLIASTDTTKTNILNNNSKSCIFLDSSLARLKLLGNNSNWFELSIPFFVAIIGGLIAIYQVRINIIKSARINWIENLRDNISRFISSTENVRIILDTMRLDVKDGIEPNKTFSDNKQTLITAFRESIMYATKVRLYLNMDESLHVELNKNIGDFIETSSNSFDNVDREKVIEKVTSTTDSIITISNNILKKEWDRVSKTWFKRIYQSICKK
jgi:hypothetical protein